MHATETLVGEALRDFGLVPSANPRHVFQSPLIDAAGKIRGLYKILIYDHRPELPDRDRKFPYLMTEQFRVGYACFKYAVSKVLQPKTICEIGVGAGTGARAFLAACPTAQYFGIDDGSKDRENGWKFLDYTAETLKSHGYNYSILLQDSMTLKIAPKVDLFHVDGSHVFDNAQNDTRLALESESEWILIDDTRDFVVVAGAMAALCVYQRSHGVAYEWAYFEDTWTGNLLLHRRTS